MVGPLDLRFSEDAVAAAKVIADFAKGNDKLVIKGGAIRLASKTLDVNGVKALARSPPGSAAVAGRWFAAIACSAHRGRWLPRPTKRGGVRRRPGRLNDEPCFHSLIYRKSSWHSIKTHS